jgi:hypothetical protein
MAIFTRRETPPSYTDPRKYTPYLRKDFIFQCAYCERTESYFGGQEAFEVDHFKPANKFPALRTTYENLYYACHKCNRHKSDAWPSDEQISRGARFADPCVEDPYVLHLRETEGGGVEELTPCGVYSSAHIRLNRPELRNWRVSRRQAREDLPLWLKVEQYLKSISELEADTEQQTIRALAAIGRRIEESRLRFSL